MGFFYKLGTATLQIDQLKNDKAKIEDSYAEQMQQLRLGKIFVYVDAAQF